MARCQQDTVYTSVGSEQRPLCIAINFDTVTQRSIRLIAEAHGPTDQRHLNQLGVMTSGQID